MTAHAPGPGILIDAAIYAQSLPMAAYLLTRQRTQASAFVVLGGLITVCANLVGEYVARTRGNNMIVGYISIPFTAGAFILALAEYQRTIVERFTLRIGLGLFIAIYLILVLFFDNVTHFGQFSHSLYSIVLLSAALWTLGRRSLTQDDGLALDTDWFWIAFGFAIYGAATAASAAIGNILVSRERYDLFAKAWNLRAAFVILAFCAISWGVFHGGPRTREVEFHR